MPADRLPPRQAPRIGISGICDADGRPVKVLPDYLTSKFVRTLHRKGGRELLVDAAGQSVSFSDALTRAKVPYIVTALVYHSKFQMTPTEQEWFLYALPDLKSAATETITHWKRWFKPSRKEGEVAPEDIRNDFPLLGDGVIVEPIDDNFYDECWRYAKSRPHKCAGHPEDPWLFTSLDPDFRVYKYTDRQQGLIHKL